MKDFDGIDLFEQAKIKAEEALKPIASNFVIAIWPINNPEMFHCYSIEGKEFTRSKKETDDMIFRQARDENISILKKHIAKKWMEELENDH